MTKRNLFLRAAAFAALATLVGCAGYRWTSRVPEDMRTVAVPNFENRTAFAELGPAVAQYTLREFQREGTFRIRRTGDSAVEVQGSIVNMECNNLSYDYRYGSRTGEYRYVLTAEVSIVDKKNGRVLQDNRRYVAETTVLVQGDQLTARRNATARLAQDFARQIVDDVVSYPYNRPDPAPAK